MADQSGQGLVFAGQVSDSTSQSMLLRNKQAGRQSPQEAMSRLLYVAMGQ
jgi:hypothetical protein